MAGQLPSRWWAGGERKAHSSHLTGDLTAAVGGSPKTLPLARPSRGSAEQRREAAEQGAP